MRCWPFFALCSLACDPPCPSARVEWEAGVLDVCVEVARTPDERAAGLVGRHLGAGEGLVLAFPVEGEVCIVNLGVPIAIDAIHVGDHGGVVGTTCGILAGDLTPYCHPSTRWVLEVAAGDCEVPVGAAARFE